MSDQEAADLRQKVFSLGKIIGISRHILSSILIVSEVSSTVVPPCPTAPLPRRRHSIDRSSWCVNWMRGTPIVQLGHLHKTHSPYGSWYMVGEIFLRRPLSVSRVSCTLQQVRLSHRHRRQPGTVTGLPRGTCGPCTVVSVTGRPRTRPTTRNRPADTSQTDRESDSQGPGRTETTGSTSRSRRLERKFPKMND